MQGIRDLSNAELLTALKEPGTHMDRGRRRRLEKQLFIRQQTRSPPPPLKRVEESNAYFLLDIKLPQREQHGKSILKQAKGKSKTVRFKPTEIFGEEAVLPNCNKNFNRNTGHLHDPKCPNAASETPEVLGEHTWMNRQFHLMWRYAI